MAQDLGVQGMEKISGVHPGSLYGELAGVCPGYMRFMRVWAQKKQKISVAVSSHEESTH